MCGGTCAQGRMSTDKTKTDLNEKLMEQADQEKDRVYKPSCAHFPLPTHTMVVQISAKILFLHISSIHPHTYLSAWIHKRVSQAGIRITSWKLSKAWWRRKNECTWRMCVQWHSKKKERTFGWKHFRNQLNQWRQENRQQERRRFCQSLHSKMIVLHSKSQPCLHHCGLPRWIGNGIAFRKTSGRIGRTERWRRGFATTGGHQWRLLRWRLQRRSDRAVLRRMLGAVSSMLRTDHRTAAARRRTSTTTDRAFQAGRS